MINVWCIPDAFFVCEVPIELGAVTKIQKLREKIVVDTDSGIKMIVPIVGSEKT